jgi:hypothetical protein
MSDCPFDNCNLKCRSKTSHKAKYAMMDARKCLKQENIVYEEPEARSYYTCTEKYIPMFYEPQYMVPPKNIDVSLLFTKIKERPIRTNIYA